MAIDIVTYKDEGEYGPVVGIDSPVYDAWLKENGVQYGGCMVGIPFGVKPDGITEFGWRTRQQAQVIAEAFGLELSES